MASGYSVLYYDKNGAIIAEKRYTKRGNAEKYAAKMIYDNKCEAATIYLINSVYDIGDVPLRSFTKINPYALSIMDY